MFKTANQLPNTTFTNRGGILYYAVSYLGKTSNPKSTTIKLEGSERWSKPNRAIVGNDNKTSLIRQIQHKVSEAYRKLTLIGKPFTAQTIIDFIANEQAFEQSIPTLLGTIDRFIQFEQTRFKRKEIGAKTNSRYPNWRKNVVDFLKSDYKANDLQLGDIKPIFATHYESFLYGKPYETRTVNKNLDFITAVLDMAVKYEWISRNPLNGHRKKPNPKGKKEYLTLEEIAELYNIDIQDSTLSEVRYQFVLMCLTGLNHADLPNLKTTDLKKDENGILCIDRGRTKKEDEYTIIPLIEITQSILQRYSDYAQKTGFLIPAISLDKTNRYLKALQAMSTIRRINITTKIGRSTYATMLGNSGVPLQDLMQSTGHSRAETILNHYLNIDRSKSAKTIYNTLKDLENQFVK